MGFFQDTAPFASVFQGVEQGQNASDYAAQQAQAQQQQQLLQRQMLLGKLKELTTQQAAVGKLPQHEQDMLNQGVPMEQIVKRRDQGVQASSLADQMRSAAMNTNLPAEKRLDLFTRAANLSSHPELMELPEYQKFGLEPPDKAPKQYEFVNKDTGAPIIYSGVGPIDPNAVPASVYSSLHETAPETPSQKMMDSPLATLTNTFVVDKDGLPWANPLDTLSSAIAKGGIPLSAKGKDAMALNSAANDDLDNLLAAGGAVLPKDTNTAKNLINPMALAGKRMVGDPDVASYDASKIALIGHLRAVANAARVNQTELEQVNGALANANSYPALQKAVEQARDLLAKSRKYLAKTGSVSVLPVPAGDVPSAPLIGKSGRKMIPDPNSPTGYSYAP